MNINNLSEIKSKVSALKGKEVVIETRESRGRIEKIKGEIRGIYPAFFNISQKGKRQFSYNYVDILTNEIVVHTPDNEIIHGPNPNMKVINGAEPEEELDLHLMTEEEMKEIIGGVPLL